MWEIIANIEIWGAISVTMIWLVTISLLVIGLVGCVVPVLPGHLIILFAAICHWLLYRWLPGQPDSGLNGWSFAMLTALMVISQGIEFFAGAAGSKWFGGTKWGALGAFAGGLVGMFFMPFGLVLGPLLGAFLFEKFFAKQEIKPAATSGVGSAVGTLAGMGVKIVVGLLMVGWFFLDVFLIGK
jgi:uncharacterized protein